MQSFTSGCLRAIFSTVSAQRGRGGAPGTTSRDLTPAAGGIVSSCGLPALAVAIWRLPCAAEHGWGALRRGLLTERPLTPSCALPGRATGVAEMGGADMMLQVRRSKPAPRLGRLPARLIRLPRGRRCSRHNSSSCARPSLRPSTLPTPRPGAAAAAPSAPCARPIAAARRALACVPHRPAAAAAASHRWRSRRVVSSPLALPSSAAAAAFPERKRLAAGGGGMACAQLARTPLDPTPRPSRSARAVAGSPPAPAACPTPAAPPPLPRSGPPGSHVCDVRLDAEGRVADIPCGRGAGGLRVPHSAGHARLFARPLTLPPRALPEGGNKVQGAGRSNRDSRAVPEA